jgi:hypothetical protein
METMPIEAETSIEQMDLEAKSKEYYNSIHKALNKLKQLRYWVFPLTLATEILGISIIIYGAARALITPAQLERPIFVILGGVLVQLIGASFLSVFKSTMVRAREVIDEPPTTDKFEKARRKIQYYMHENLTQVKNIYRLTVGAMLLGFVIIIYGATIAYTSEQEPAASIVVTLSGVLVQFIGATFLIVYRSTNEQAREYVEILERINTVGMSVALIEKITSDDELNKARANIASDILSLHGLEKREEKQNTTV